MSVGVEHHPNRHREPARRLERPDAFGLLARFLHAATVVVRNAIVGVVWHDGVMVASAIAFSMIFALFPFMIFLVALGALVGGPQLGDYVSREALGAFPEHMVRTIQPELQRIFATPNKTSLLSFGLAVTLISITGCVEAVRDGLNRAYRCAEDRGPIRRYGSDLLFVFIGMFFVLAMASLGIVVPVWLRYLEASVLDVHFELGLLRIAREALIVIIMGVTLALVHLVLPARKRRVKSVATGALVTLVGWWICGRLFGMYLSQIANYSATYAGLGGTVALMFFLYIQALIFIFGAELNRSISEFHGRRDLCRKQS
ncbi:YihY/virulence factor BrkB family protein [Propylenella binzhouense]|uniref:YihY/virulence factor BrkB family protein n=1 Tax=Propylenella binzhouense TaxID=2555902 RepID=A0A964T6C8_9HYPH|nr:YihY/virulence factor BrkB family protein [Propylenella binzhouense]MYZ48644.1 YihY/virulence factor BrkB family protein [Propylenella binzhouense]